MPSRTPWTNTAVLRGLLPILVQVRMACCPCSISTQVDRIHGLQSSAPFLLSINTYPNICFTTCIIPQIPSSPRIPSLPPNLLCLQPRKQRSSERPRRKALCAPSRAATRAEFVERLVEEAPISFRSICFSPHTISTDHWRGAQSTEM